MSVAFFLLMFVTSKTDAWWNSSWLANVDYKWWNLFTTHHYLAWLSLHNQFLHVVVVAAMSAVLTTVCMVFMKRQSRTTR
jgi:ABC-type Fe3+ transport system permease subunit